MKEGNYEVLERIVTIPAHRTAVKQAEDALNTLDGIPLYARIDGVIRHGARFLAYEMELNEPALYLEYAPEQAPRFAEAIHSVL